MIEVPEWDPNLTGHSAVLFEGERGEVCHAVVTEYTDEGQRQVTVCGIEIDGQVVESRDTFREAGVRMCGECWPLEELEENLTGSECL
jgi:NAD(P)H-flavin reductase